MSSEYAVKYEELPLSIRIGIVDSDDRFHYAEFAGDKSLDIVKQWAYQIIVHINRVQQVNREITGNAPEYKNWIIN